MEHEMSGAPMAEGWWCTSCEFFEDDDQINTEVEICIVCGCPGAAHLRADVVAR